MAESNGTRATKTLAPTLNGALKDGNGADQGAVFRRVQSLLLTIFKL
jgi:hypothetical protein